jgi:multidrug efflux pump subunit AcrB
MLSGYLYVFRWLFYPLNYCRRHCDFGMTWTIRNVYAPAVQAALHYRIIFMIGSCCALALSIVAVTSGKMPFVFFPKMDGNVLQANVIFPNGTPAEVTERWTKHLERSFWKVAKEYEDAGAPVAMRSCRVVGTSVVSRGMDIAGLPGGGNSSAGGVTVELIDGDRRNTSSMELANRWREASGAVPGAEELTFESQMFGPQGGAIEFMLLAPPNDADKLKVAVQECKEYLAGIDGVTDIKESDIPGKYEFRLKIKERAMAMGIHPSDLANVIRATYYGAEVQRLQRGRHEVKVMVCYPREDRRSLGDFNEIRIRTASGEFPITELAEIEVVRGYTSITRRNQKRSITVSADVDEDKANARKITAALNKEFLPKLLEKYPGFSVQWGGETEELQESMSSLVMLFCFALCVMFVLLAIQFRSYLQPFMILAVIPFGWIGVVITHWAFGLPITMPSAFGFVALAGVIINDSILMIDFINRRIQEGGEVYDAAIQVGKERFRPIFLTSVTTFGGLLPMVLETSLQAKIMIPMALSLAGGVMFALFFVLLFIPVLYSYYVELLAVCGIEVRSAESPA